jgi:putative glutamine amidotransferase
VSERPLILVSASHDAWRPYWIRSFSAPLIAAGANSHVLSVLEAEGDRRDALRVADGLLLCGGHDIEPHYYGADDSPLIGPTDPHRDAVELPLVREAIELGVPLVGSCRGMQVISVSLGGTLYRDASEHPGAERHPSGGVEGFKPFYRAEMCGGPAPQALTHLVITRRGSWLGATLGERIELNSYHHQHLRDLPLGLRATAVASDGVIEGVELSATKALALGVEWELQVGWREDRRQFDLFRRFVEAAAERRALRTGIKL